mmetsp:Transcript_814/g.2775  ORF Transcript_814/g.2775 Transcript_814/m.2775 type:complete len:199 (+) Transcript_814:2931-3527(+)
MYHRVDHHCSVVFWRDANVDITQSAQRTDPKNVRLKETMLNFEHSTGDTTKRIESPAKTGWMSTGTGFTHLLCARFYVCENLLLQQMDVPSGFVTSSFTYCDSLPSILLCFKRCSDTSVQTVSNLHPLFHFYPSSVPNPYSISRIICASLSPNLSSHDSVLLHNFEFLADAFVWCLFSKQTLGGSIVMDSVCSRWNLS